jgi:hypothetical protein
MAVAALLAGGAVALTGATAGASGLAITSVKFTTSNNAANVTTPTTPNTAAYTWSFKTTTTSVIAHSIKFSLPTGVTATGTIAVTPYGLPTGGTCGSSTTTVTSTAIKLTFASTYCTIPAGTSIEVTMTGTGKYKNGGVSTYKAKVTISNGTTTTSGTAAGTPFVSNVTKVKVTVPESLTFTNSNSTILLMPVPGTSTILTATAVVLKVATNAHKGYRLAACMANLKTTTTTPNATIANPGATPASTFTGFAAKPAYSGSATHGLTWSTGTQYSGYATTCTAAPATGHTVLMKSTGPTPTVGPNQVSVTNGVKVPSNQAAGVYTGTIVYQVTPKFT